MLKLRLKKKDQAGFLKLLRLLVLTIIAIALIHVVSVSHVHAQKKTDKVNSAAPSSLQLQTMANNINGINNANPNLDIGVSIIDLNNGASQQLGETDAFEAASTTKLLTAADYLHHVERGSASLSDQVNGSTANYELQQMIEVSDDNAWQAFNGLLGHPDLLSYANSIGLNSYDPDANTITTNDMALLLQKLYKGQLLNSNDTKLLLNYMANANYTEYIGSVIPDGISFYHKAGLLNDRVHDAGILDNGNQAIVLVIFTKNENDNTAPADNQVTVLQNIASEVVKAYF